MKKNIEITVSLLIFDPSELSANSSLIFDRIKIHFSFSCILLWSKSLKISLTTCLTPLSTFLRITSILLKLILLLGVCAVSESSLLSSENEFSEEPEDSRKKALILNSLLISETERSRDSELSLLEGASESLEFPSLSGGMESSPKFKLI